ncbi:hypothetical protein BBP40_006070 [Aspergillus hancockii]|nr:hypothetical protein BBP40_006070 [Aspergillus hancockii]
MARCILEICPTAKLYIARLDDSGKVTNQLFTTTSTCEAANNSAKLVKSAVASGKIIPFGSLRDKGPTDTSPYAPCGLEDLIKISSATVWGKVLEENRFAKPEFLLPGEDLEINTVPPQIVSGSSFATTYASGPGALVHYCLKAHVHPRDLDLGRHQDSQDHRIRHLNRAKSVDGMRTTFTRLCGDDEKHLFIRPYLVFKKDFGVSEADRKADMGNLASRILPTDPFIPR